MGVKLILLDKNLLSFENMFLVLFFILKILFNIDCFLFVGFLDKKLKKLFLLFILFFMMLIYWCFIVKWILYFFINGFIFFLYLFGGINVEKNIWGMSNILF